MEKQELSLAKVPTSSHVQHKNESASVADSCTKARFSSVHQRAAERFTLSQAITSSNPLAVQPRYFHSILFVAETDMKEQFVNCLLCKVKKEVGILN